MGTGPIGVFDSGVGGLTVLRALRERLPGERYLYLGDTARLPYGTKSAATVERYSVQCARLLVERGIDALVVACNTASAVALPALRSAFPGLAVVGVVQPGAAAAVAATRGGRIAVIATEGTVRGGAYERAIRALRPDAAVIAIACPLFVALAEEGWTEGPVVDAVARRYLEPPFAAADAPDTLVLGCTHFPVFAPAIARLLGPGVAIVDSAATTAATLAAMRAASTAIEVAGAGGEGPTVADEGRHGAVDGLRVLATDGAERFARVSRTFGVTVEADAVELVELGAAQGTA